MQCQPRPSSGGCWWGFHLRTHFLQSTLPLKLSASCTDYDVIADMATVLPHSTFKSTVVQVQARHEGMGAQPAGAVLRMR